MSNPFDVEVGSIDEIKEKTKAFAELVDSISELSDKKKSLWKDVYANALRDRHSAYSLYDNLETLVIADPQTHAIHGPNLAKYLERAAKSNEQLLKLADLVAQADEKSKELSEDDVYAALRK
jgi:uncharacterized coiled-coil DUF342 family protein